MTDKFTPGPWSRANNRLVVQKSTGDLIAGVQGKEQMGEMDANSRLISAAPELLMALESLIEALPEEICCGELVSPALDSAYSAIAKARGEA